MLMLWRRRRPVSGSFLEKSCNIGAFVVGVVVAVECDRLLDDQSGKE